MVIRPERIVAPMATARRATIIRERRRSRELTTILI
jgi:hypothetical protein